MGRVWLWLGSAFAAALAVVVGIAFLFRTHPRWDALKVAGSAAFLAVMMPRQSRSESGQLWRALPSLKPETFRYVLLPHLLTCAGGLIAAACLILISLEPRTNPKAWSNSMPGALAVIALTLGGAALSLFGLFWGKRRRAAAGLP